MICPFGIFRRFPPDKKFFIQFEESLMTGETVFEIVCTIGTPFLSFVKGIMCCNEAQTTFPVSISTKKADAPLANSVFLRKVETVSTVSSMAT